MDDFILPGYDIDELLGFGGSGEVWRALERSSGDVVALKRLHRGDDAGTSEASDRLRREAALLASVTHDHLVRLRAVVPTGHGLVLVLDYAAGGSLAAVLAARGRVSAGEVVTIGAPLAQALADVHARGVVHGDVTPGNVLFDANGKPLLADLGVASLAGEQGATVGVTFGYADPALELVLEGANGIRPGPQSDVHGLAAVCFHALAGVPPYGADERGARALRSLAPGVPASLVSAIEAALDPDPLARPDAATFARMLFASCAPVAVILAKPAGPVIAATTQAVRARPSVGPRPASSARVLPPVVDPGAKVGGRHRWVARRVVLFRRAAIAVVAITLLGGAVAAGVGWAGHDHSAAASPVADAAPAAASSGASPAATPASPPAATSSGVDDAVPAAAGDWTAVVDDLDRVRDAAYVNGNADDLAAVYVPGAAALATDGATLRQLMTAGERARGLTFQLVSVAVASRAAGQVTLSVRDTLPAYELVSASGATQTVAGRGERSWAVVVRADPAGGAWRIASITAEQ